MATDELSETEATIKYYENENARLRQNMSEVKRFNKSIVAENEEMIKEVKRLRNISIAKEQAIFEDGRRCGFAYGAGMMLLAVLVVLVAYAA
jgi:hypothetical protein